MSTQEIVPLYMNWAFWAVVISFLALVLSQLPPVRIMLKRSKVDFELYSKAVITHWVGNPIVQLHILINNVGGTRLRIKAIQATIVRDGLEVVTLPTQNFFQNPGDKESVLFTSVTLDPGEEWGHQVRLLNYFNREEEKQYRALESKLKDDIFTKRTELGRENQELVAAKPEVWLPLKGFCKDRFIWTSGEYELRIKVITNLTAADAEKCFRFTIFESYEEELRRITEEYKYGAGVYWEPNAKQSVLVDLSEA